MPQKVKMNDFSLGWTPNDSSLNGRKNGLLKMTSVTLDETGALVLANGTKKGTFQYPSDAHTLYSKVICNEERNYLALEDGSVYRNSTKIVNTALGSTTRAAFGSYRDYALIFSGSTRIKDACSGVVTAFGLQAPLLSPIANILRSALFQDDEITGEINNWTHNYTGYTNGFGSPTIFTKTGPGAYQADVGAYDPLIPFQGIRSIDNGYTNNGSAKDLSGGSEDLFSMKVSSDRITTANQISVVFLLNPNFRGAANTVENPDEMLFYDFNRDAILAGVAGNTTTLEAARSSFSRVGSNLNLGWESVYGMLVVCYFPITVEDAVVDVYDFKIQGGGKLNGNYEYAQVNVHSGVVKSALGPVTSVTGLVNAQVEVIPEDPTILSRDVDEVWIYRRGERLDRFYRVARIQMDALAPFYDNLTDEEVLAFGIAYEPLLTVDSANLTEEIIEIVGPVNGRILYFSTTKIYFSEINAPDNYNPSQVITIAGDESEKLLWAKKIASGVVIIGTTQDLYTLTGTMVTMPDGGLDVFLRSQGIDHPPVCRDAAIYQGAVYYFAPGGWRAVSLDNNSVNLTSTISDLLYNGISRHEYGGVPSVAADGFRYSIIIIKDKMFVVVPVIADYGDPTNPALWEARLEVFDLVRKYWRPLNYAPSLMVSTEKGNLLGYFDTQGYLNEMDYPHTKLLNV